MADPIDKGPARAETGPMRFGDDWTGVFLRGDYAGPMGMTIRAIIDGTADVAMEHIMLSSLANCLSSCAHEAPEAQQLPDFATVSALVARCERYEQALREIERADGIATGEVPLERNAILRRYGHINAADAIVEMVTVAREALKS